MASAFDKWEKDPFFPAAEEVQASADRMESTYRTWIHAKKDTSGAWDLDELRRNLQTTLGTTKWQLDEFHRAVRSSYTSSSSPDDAKDRHSDFINAIENQTSKVESSLTHGKSPSPWLRLDEGERNELALFLSGPPPSSTSKITAKIHGQDQRAENVRNDNQQTMTKCSHLVEWDLGEGKVERFPGHRRTASASADIGSWTIGVNVLPSDSSIVAHDPPPRKIPSFAGFLNSMESQLKWPKNGYKKLKLPDCHEEPDMLLPRSQNLTKGVHMCYEKNKSCIEGCEDCYEKQLYGWYGTAQRLIQRSQYHMQYSRPAQVALSIILLICFCVVLVLHAF